MEKEVENPVKNPEMKELEKPEEVVESVKERVHDESQQSMEEVLEEKEAGMTEELQVKEGEEIEEVVEPEIEKGAMKDFVGNKQEELGENDAKQSVENKSVSLEETKAEKPAKSYKKILIGIIISFCALLGIYFGMSKYFVNRFYFGSEINAINVSGKTVEDVEALLASELQSYTLNLKLRDGKSELIKSEEVGLKYSSNEEIEKFKEGQNPYNWVLAYFNKKNSKITIGVSYDEKLLKERIDKLSCFDSANIIEPKNPSFQYKDNGFVIVDEVIGNRVDKDILYTQVLDSLIKEEAELDLEARECYVNPKYTSKAEKVVEAKDKLNKYAASKITYNSGGKSEVLDGSIISKWLSVDENFEVIFDEEKVKEYVDTLAKTFNTVGKTRNFVTTSGKTINIGGGDYGWAINKSKETQSLIAAIKEGQTITKEPTYSQTAYSHGNDIGNTYVEIDLSDQHLWFYKNGSLVVEGSIVSGNIRTGHTTPKGVYKLKYKDKNVVLRGQDYAAPVTFWMPFNGGIGLHDASWRSSFGGSIYKTNGSHGCINCPYNLAKTIYNNIQVGTPVICYY